MRYGSLDVKTLALALPDGLNVSRAATRLGGEERPAALRADGNRVVVEWPEKLRVRSDRNLEVTLT